MKVIDFCQTNSILNQYISEIRNVEVQNDRLRFRRNIERIGEIMAYEMSKEFNFWRNKYVSCGSKNAREG